MDSIAIEPGSISTTFTYDFQQDSQIIFIESSADSVDICYRVLSTFLTGSYTNRDLEIYDGSRQIEETSKAESPLEKEELFNFPGIEKYGAITRGVSFGNRQSVFVNSSLNLQMDGQVADNLYVSAVITDQNIPYQPEGNTQQLRDFDNVFIKLYNDNFAVTAGDIVLMNPVQEDYFLKYYKNVQGLQLSYQNTENLWKHSTTVSGAASKGKFASTVLQAVEGLTGPYKLRGPNGERFIIVLANSEKVFLDGVLMQRGFDKDYVIDYNLGEVTFGNHIIITQFSRIRVDFEYSEQFYSRSNLAVSSQVENETVKFYTGFYRARDNPNSNFGFSLDQNDLSQLQSIGDQIENAFVSGADSVIFDANSILYKKIDTLDLDGNSHTIFFQSSDQNDVLFGTTFSDVGIGNGDYVLRETTSNGRIYEWVSPVNGERQGRYQPGAFIPLPNSQQLVNVGTEIKLSPYEMIFSEGAFSSFDQNLYSSIDDGDNNGMGYHAGIRSSGRSSFLADYKWSGALSFEYDSKNFNAIDRYRAIEFDRNWDLAVDTLNSVQDFIIFGETALRKNKYNVISYKVNRREREKAMTGLQQEVQYDQTLGFLRLQSTHSYLNGTQGQFISSEWVQSRSDLSYNQFKIVPGYVHEVNQNELTRLDSVINTRMHYKSHEVYLVNGDSTNSRFRIAYILRDDKLPVQGKMEDFLRSRNLKMNYTTAGQRSNLAIDLNYRSTDDKLGLNTGNDEIISGRVNWWGTYLNKHLTQNFSFSTGNSRELKREFVYLPVTTGEGTHTWRDQNEDGIQDLNEFFEAINPDERNYVKIFTPTDEYLTSFQTFYIHTIDARLPFTWRKQGGFKSFISKFSANVNLNINYRTTAESYSDRLNPLSITLDDPSLLSAKDQKRYTLFFNRNGRGFAGDFALRTVDNKQLLTQGFELKRKRDWISNFKIDLTETHAFRLISSIGEFRNQSDFLTSRNFKILTDSYEPQLIWRPTRSLRIIGSYERKNKNNRLLETSTESTVIQRYKGELTWNQVGQGSLRSSFSWVKIDFTGDESTYLAYLLLDALRPGTNQTWQINWQQKMSKGMQLSLVYNGRKSEESGAIHTGNVQVTAYF